MESRCPCVHNNIPITDLKITLNEVVCEMEKY